MTQRTWAALLAVPLLVALGVFTAFSPLPFVTYAPGPTINVLGDAGGKPIIDVQGHPTYRDSGELRMTTVSVTQRNADLDLLTLMQRWFSTTDGIYPFVVQYGSSGSQQNDAHEGQVEMKTSQHAAVAAALTELGYHVTFLRIAGVDKGMPAEGKLQVGDVVRRIGTTKVTATTDVGTLIAAVPTGGSVPITVLRQGSPVTVRVTPTTKNGTRLVGVTLGVGLHPFPFKVKVNIDKTIGGPSAGLMFALSIYDTLTPGSLTSGGTVAGTGTINALGQVGEIGGIQQKIAGADHDGAQLFLVPPANCPDAMTSHHGSMRLARAATLKEAISEVTAWGKNHDATLPQCTAADGTSS
ncbi:MAG TPA: PDZ domain-containing protein [Nocardioides sp.]|nr:PDZ domain-containing protein [Nocardioides sp.]